MDRYCSPLVCRSEAACRAGYLLSALMLVAWIFLGGYVLAQVSFRTALLLSGVMIASFITNTFIKFVTRRERPEPLDEFGARFHLGVQKKSFPSCHAQLSFTALVLIYHVYPVLIAPAVILALLTSFLRYYIGRHWLEDIIAGILIGMAVGLAGVFLLR
jgi:membrane-associated phospholipid phosphatase